MEDIFGQDIKVDDAGQALVTANGELLLTVGVETGVQDIKLRLGASPDGLFYDQGFISLVYEWIKEESTAANRMAFEAEVERRIQADPRVVIGTAQCRVTTWDERSLVATAQWEFIGEDHPYNLVISVDGLKNEMVIKDVNPRPGL